MYLPGIGQVSPDEVTLAGIGAGGVILTNVLSGMPAFARKSEKSAQTKGSCRIQYNGILRSAFSQISEYIPMSIY